MDDFTTRGKGRRAMPAFQGKLANELDFCRPNKKKYAVFLDIALTVFALALAHTRSLDVKTCMDFGGKYSEENLGFFWHQCLVALCRVRTTRRTNGRTDDMAE